MGVSELSTICVGKEIRADCVLLDDPAARRLGKLEGLKVLGVVGLLESFYLGGYLADLRTSFRQLLAHSYIDRRILDRRLQALGLDLL